MHGLEWIVATLFTGLSSYILMFTFCFEDNKDRTITFILLFITETSFAIFVTGAGLKSLTNGTLLSVDTVLLFLSAALAVIRRHRLLPAVQWHGFRSLQLDGIGIAYGLVLVLLLVLAAYVGHLLPPYAYDELNYHLVAVASWIHNHRIVDTEATLWANVYPKNAELVFTWLYMSVNGDAWIHLGQWLFGIVGIVATMACARMLGLNRSRAVMTGTLFFATPTVLLQATTDYNDLAFASMFLVFFYFYLRFVQERPDLRYTILAGVAAGMTLGIKSSALVYIAVCGLVMAVWTGWQLRSRRVTWCRMGLHVVLFIVPVLLLGTYWYSHTWAVYGNPLYPFTVALHGHVIFPGKGTVNQLIMVPNTPASLLHLPWWREVWISWTTIPTYFAYDMQIGGYGLQWTIAEWPALTIFCVYCLLRQRLLLVRAILPLVVIFVLQPANWWGRYTLFMVSLGAWAFVYMVSLIWRPWLRRALSIGLLAVIGGSYVLGVGLFFLLHKRDSGLVSQAILRALHTSPQNRTVGSVVFPEYAWVDKLSAPTTIGCTDHVPFVYALYGRGAKNTVFLVQSNTVAAFLRQVRTHYIRFFMTEKKETYDQWATQHPEIFQLYRSEGNYNVYKVST